MAKVLNRIAGVMLLGGLGSVAALGAPARHDHYVTVKSTAPSMVGKPARDHVREVTDMRSGGGRGAKGVVLFIHGAGTPAEVAFDAPIRIIAGWPFWLRAGFDVFAMDMTGYGRSTRPPPMNDPCNLSSD